MDSAPHGLRASLAGRYDIERELGRGGMAIVFLARDRRHGRPVALKVLRRDLGLGGGHERFLREIGTAAPLHHPHILPLYDSGTAGDDLFYVMPYVEGESLRQRLERDGTLPIDEALRITREVADALAYAHARGVVHRDIKPENILLSGGHAWVTDFGIARAVDAAGGRLTETGLAIGTPLYMSPEQILAQASLDGRADQYSLGCVVYEMLTGTPPFAGPDALAVMAQHTIDAAPSLRTHASVPPALDAPLQRALAKRADDRWPTTREFALALDHAAGAGGQSRPGPGRSQRALARVAALGAATALVAIGLWLGTGRSGADAAAPPWNSVAVLPAAFAGDTTQALIADGLTDGLIAGLVRVPGLRIGTVERSTARLDSGADPRATGEALGVEAVVSTTVRIVANRIRVTARLTRTRDGSILWSDQFDGEVQRDGAIADVFRIQDDFATRLVTALVPRVTGAEPAVVARGQRTTDPVAYSLYLQARRVHITGGTARDVRDARILADSSVVLLRAAIRRDSTFADAWAMLADALLWQEVFGGFSPQLVVAQVREAVERALALDPQHPEAHARRAELRWWNDWDWVGARRDFQRAVELAPSSGELLSYLAHFRSLAGEPDSGIALARRAIALDPDNAAAHSKLAYGFAFAGARDSALAASRRTIALDSLYVPVYWVLAQSLLDAGRKVPADSAAERMVRLSGRSPEMLAQAAAYHRRAGNGAAALAIVEELTERARIGGEYISPVSLSVARFAAGDTAGALDALEDAERVRDRFLLVSVAANLAPLRGHPRYDRVLRAVWQDRTPVVPFP